jgi:hypothetical protein
LTAQIDGRSAFLDPRKARGNGCCMSVCRVSVLCGRLVLGLGRGTDTCIIFDHCRGRSCRRGIHGTSTGFHHAAETEKS